MRTYFTIEELIKSDTATEKKIDNTPNALITNNLKYVIERLNPIREEFGKPIYVTSGYRCPRLNKLVGGSTKSAHLQGLAVDITTYNRDENKRLFNLIRSKYQFDQLIDEKDLSWIHLGFKTDKKNERNVIYRM